MPVFRDQRLNAVIDALIASFPDGLTTPELADRFGVTRQTSHKDVIRLQDANIPVKDSETRSDAYTINPREYIRPLNLSLAQAWTLYLPLRRMIRAQMHRSIVVQGLLKRLVTALDPKIGDHLLPSDTPTVQTGEDVLRTLTDAWRDEYLVDITYKPLNQSSSRHLIAPYWFEPTVWSDSIYVIAGLYGYGTDPQPITLKVDRIQSIVIRTESFERPHPEDVLEYLSGTWGIWVGDEPAKVRLRFHNRQQQRLQETRWHPTEQITDQEDGSVLWEATVSEPQEMVSWIRGWGPDVEVLEPEHIREQIALDAERTARLYGRCAGDEGYF